MSAISTIMVQDAPIFSLPPELLEHIGRMIPDVPNVIAYTTTCRSLKALRPKILTTDLSKLQFVLQRLLKHQTHLPAFLEHCKISPFRTASFELQSTYLNQLHCKKLIEGVLPKVKVHLIPQAHQFVLPRIVWLPMPFTQAALQALPQATLRIAAMIRDVRV